MARINAATADKAKKNDEALPSGAYYVRKETAEADPEKAMSKSGKYMPRIGWKVVEPDEFKGRRIFPDEYFVLGTDDDLMAENEDTAGPGLGRLKRVCDAAGVPCEGDVPDIIEEIEHVGAILERYIEPPTNRDGSANQYAGQIRNKIKSYFSQSDRSPEIFPEAGSPKAPTGASRLPKSAAGTATANRTNGFGAKKAS